MEGCVYPRLLHGSDGSTDKSLLENSKDFLLGRSVTPAATLSDITCTLERGRRVINKMVDIGPLTTSVVRNLTSDVTYYLTVTAYNPLGRVAHPMKCARIPYRLVLERMHLRHTFRKVSMRKDSEQNC